MRAQMHRRPPRLLVAGLSILLAGCAAAHTGARAGDTMAMPGGSSMAVPSSTAGSTSSPVSQMGAGPSASARMVCGADIGAAAALSLALHAPPRGSATWADHLYRCTFRLPVGPLVLSVKESPDVASARSYFNALRQQVPSARPLLGLASLGLPAFTAPDGTAVFLKDNKTLRVDATALPAAVGPARESRAEFAYTMASDVLGCWTGK